MPKITKIGLIAIFILISLPLWGQVRSLDVYVSKYGELESALGDKWDKVDSLVVHGPVNAEDFHTMWKCSYRGQMRVLNLQYAQVEGNKIPDDAFFRIDEMDKIEFLKIDRIILPDEITEIGRFAFCDTKVKYVNMPKKLKKFNRSSFYNCLYLTGPIVIPEGVEEIPDRCFENCKRIDKVVLPSTIKSIGMLAFYYTELKEINLPEGLEQIGELALGANDMKKISLPSTLYDAQRDSVRVGKKLFSLCYFLKEIQLPDNFTKIPRQMAEDCTELEKINIPKNLVVIAPYAFDHVSKLKSIQLPEGLKRIEKGAFYAVGLEKLVLPSTLEFLGDKSCQNLSLLKEIYCRAKTPPFIEGQSQINGAYSCAFNGAAKNAILYVPKGSSERYKMNLGWSYFSIIREIPDDEFPAEVIAPKEGNDNKVKVYGRDLSIILQPEEVLPAGMPYSVFSLSGEVVKQGRLSEMHTLTMPTKGTYIVRVGRTIHKIQL